MKRTRTKRLRYIIPWLLLMLLLIGINCETYVDLDYEPQLNVFGILSNGQQRQEILVDRTYQIDEPSGSLIDDALVIISRDNLVDTLEYSIIDDRYISDPFTIVPEGTYNLLVVRDGFDTLQGATTIPGNFTIIFPVYGDTLTLQDTITLTRSEGAVLYTVSFIMSAGVFGPFIWHEPDSSDTLVHIPVADYWEPPVEGYFTIYITAYDSNCYEYYLAEQDSIAQAGVTGGVGLFGSMWTRYTSTYVLFE
jgi:hypothetical protein